MLTQISMQNDQIESLRMQVSHLSFICLSSLIALIATYIISNTGCLQKRAAKENYISLEICRLAPKLEVFHTAKT